MTSEQQNAAPTPEQRLSAIRVEIDDVDHKLLDLLNRRAALSREVGRIKSTDPDGIVF